MRGRTTVSLLLFAVLVATEAFASDPTQPNANGPTTPTTVAVQTARPNHALAPVSQRFAALNNAETPSFRRHVDPLLGRLGCNGRACHGSFQGRGGFRLSLFGYDFKMDLGSLVGADPPRVNTRDPELSLVLQKPTLQVPHEGGQRFKLGGWEHHLLSRWIEEGAIGLQSTDLNSVHLEVSPAEIVFSQKGERIPLQAIAHWSADWSSKEIVEDVTPLCRFQSNDEQVATVSPDGIITSVGTGDSHIVVSYDLRVVPVIVMRPVSDRTGSRYPDVPTPTDIDRLVVKKLRKLGIVPSSLCTDAEFLRRVSLDLTGTLPAADEVTGFLTDTAIDKRQRKVDELLQRPTYAAWWTTRLCDITGDNDLALGNSPFGGRTGGQEWYDWLLRRVRDNVPYDQIVEGIVLASSRRPGQSYGDYAKEMSDLYRKGSQRSYADRPGLTHFWARRTVSEPQQKALSFAYTFLGIRIQCAECHKHPYDQWTQQDYRDFAKFFARVRSGIDPYDVPERDAILESIRAVSKTGVDPRREFPRILSEGKTIPFDEVWVEPVRRRAPLRKPASPPVKLKAAKPGVVKIDAQASDGSRPKKTAAAPSTRPRIASRKALPPVDPHPTRARLLGGPLVPLTRYDDPRVPLMEWLRSRDNPYFARAFVNRVWASYFNVGIVNPPDDLSLANPPSNAELLADLADRFVKHGYDMKWLHREIVNSQTYQRGWQPNQTNHLDERNFSHAILRRLPAEVAYDALRQATASDAIVAHMQTDCSDRAIGRFDSGRDSRRGLTYALRLLGRSVRETNCDCDRSNEPSLFQTIFFRNDADVLAMIGDQKTGWVAQVAAGLKAGAAMGLSEQTKTELVRSAYLRTLSRTPNPAETTRARTYLETSDRLSDGLRDLVWALVNTREFIVNR